MKLHYHPLSSYSCKVLIGLGVRQDEFERHELNPFAGDLKSLDFLALNPFGKMPVLETADGPIFESTSILEYLEERGPRRLIPTGQERRCRHFDRLGDLYLLHPIGEYFWDKADEQRKETERLTSIAWKIWESELKDGRKFICGADVTLADLSAAVAANYCLTEGVAIPPEIADYFARLRSVSAVSSVLDAAAPFVAATLNMRMSPGPASGSSSGVNSK